MSDLLEQLENDWDGFMDFLLGDSVSALRVVSAAEPGSVGSPQPSSQP